MMLQFIGAGANYNGCRLTLYLTQTLGLLSCARHAGRQPISRRPSHRGVAIATRSATPAARLQALHW